MEDNTLNYGEKLKAIRFSARLNQGDFADSLDLKQGSYSDIERGKISLSSRTLNILAKKYRINLNWLINDIGEMFLEDTKTAQTHVNRNVKICDDKGKELQEMYIPELEGEHTGIVAKGNAMQPTITEGDIVIFKWLLNKEDIQHNYLYIVQVEDVLLIKRIIINSSHQITLQSDNPFHSNIVISQADIKKVGKITNVIKNIN